MRKHDKADKQPPGAQQPEPSTDEAAVAEELARLEADDERLAAATRAAGALAETAEAEIERLQREVLEWKERALRATADFDNYRKRAMRERDEGFGRGQGDVLGRIVDIIDDLARVAHLDPVQTSSEALHEGMLAIERKFLKALEAVGVERVDPVGQPFDPKIHEAVATQPAAAPEQDHTVGATYQHGYLFKGTLLRPARVAVLTYTPAAGSEGVM